MTDVNLKSHPPLSFLTSPACEVEKCKKTRHHLPELSASATSQGVTCFLWCSESASHSLSPKIRESGQRVRVHEGRELRARGEKKRREKKSEIECRCVQLNTRCHRKPYVICVIFHYTVFHFSFRCSLFISRDGISSLSICRLSCASSQRCTNALFVCGYTDASFFSSYFLL